MEKWPRLIPEESRVRWTIEAEEPFLKVGFGLVCSGVVSSHLGRGHPAALYDHLPGAGHKASDPKEQSRGHKEQRSQ